MKLNEALIKYSDLKDSLYIVYRKKDKTIVYVGDDKQIVNFVETKETNTLKPLIKNRVSKEKQKEYLNNPSLYSL